MFNNWHLRCFFIGMYLGTNRSGTEYSSICMLDLIVINIVDISGFEREIREVQEAFCLRISFSKATSFWYVYFSTRNLELKINRLTNRNIQSVYYYYGIMFKETI